MKLITKNAALVFIFFIIFQFDVKSDDPVDYSIFDNCGLQDDLSYLCKDGRIATELLSKIYRIYFQGNIHISNGSPIFPFEGEINEKIKILFEYGLSDERFVNFYKSKNLCIYDVKSEFRLTFHCESNKILKLSVFRHIPIVDDGDASKIIDSVFKYLKEGNYEKAASHLGESYYGHACNHNYTCNHIVASDFNVSWLHEFLTPTNRSANNTTDIIYLNNAAFFFDKKKEVLLAVDINNPNQEDKSKLNPWKAFISERITLDNKYVDQISVSANSYIEGASLSNFLIKNNCRNTDFVGVQVAKRSHQALVYTSLCNSMDKIIYIRINYDKNKILLFPPKIMSPSFFKINQNLVMDGKNTILFKGTNIENDNKYLTEKEEFNRVEACLKNIEQYQSIGSSFLRCVYETEYENVEENLCALYILDKNYELFYETTDNFNINNDLNIMCYSDQGILNNCLVPKIMFDNIDKIHNDNLTEVQFSFEAYKRKFIKLASGKFSKLLYVFHNYDRDSFLLEVIPFIPYEWIPTGNPPELINLTLANESGIYDNRCSEDFLLKELIKSR